MLKKTSKVPRIPDLILTLVKIFFIVVLISIHHEKYEFPLPVFEHFTDAIPQ